MNELLRYTTAVATRHAINPKTNRMNYAIAMQLEQKDLPLLLEIIRVQDAALEKIWETADNDSEECAMAELALNKVEDLAKTGSVAKWGEYDGDA